MKVKHKIIHVIETLGIGGAEKSLVENLSVFSQNFSHIVVIIGGPIDLVREIDSTKTPVYNLEVDSKYSYHKIIYKLIKIIRKERPSLIHTSLYHTNVTGRLAALITGTKVLSSIVSTNYDPVRYQYDPGVDPGKHRIIRMIDLFTANISRCRFMAISNNAKDSAVKYGGFYAGSISVIYRGVDHAKYSRSTAFSLRNLREGLNIQSSFPVLLNVGRLIRAKGQIHLIDAMPRITQKFPDARLLIAGEGHLRNELETRIKDLDMDGHITLLGRKTNIRDYYAISDVFIFSSNWEGLGISLIEAMAMELPIIATRTGSAPEIIGDNRCGYLVPIAESEAISDAVMKLCSDKERMRSLGQRGRKIVEQKFNIHNNANQLEALYREIINGGHVTIGL